MDSTPDLVSSLSFKDFSSDYIRALANSRGLVYTASTTSLDVESGLYNNAKTNTIELHKLDMAVDGLACEYYTASFIPIRAPGAEKASDEDRIQVQVFSVTLPFDVEPVYVESKTTVTANNVLGLSSLIFKEGRLVELEGDFNHYFRVHTPRDGEVGAFTILAPNIMVRLLEDAGNFDFEFAKNKIYFYQMTSYGLRTSSLLTQKEYDDLLQFGIESARVMARAARPTKQLGGSKTAMWEIYGASTKDIGRIMGLAWLGVIIIMVCLTIPFLWPVFGFISVYVYYRYKKLVVKKKQLIARWKRGETMKVIKGVAVE